MTFIADASKYDGRCWGGEIGDGDAPGRVDELERGSIQEVCTLGGTLSTEDAAAFPAVLD